ncbi:MAG: helix-turn-helix domain-containing protein [Nakamurella sp.]
MTRKSSERISAEERREQILAAASRVFGERGYYGATTDQIAKAAGISQPYVVRMFGSKEQLFIEVLGRAIEKLAAALRAVIVDNWDEDNDAENRAARIGAAYVDLIKDRGILLSIMQGFIVGHDPVIGPLARAGFVSIYRILRDEAGMGPDEASDILATGMLFNTLLALRLPDEYEADADVRELIDCTFRSKVDMVLGIVAKDAADRK